MTKLPSCGCLSVACRCASACSKWHRDAAHGIALFCLQATLIYCTDSQLNLSDGQRVSPPILWDKFEALKSENRAILLSSAEKFPVVTIRDGKKMELFLAHCEKASQDSGDTDTATLLQHTENALERMPEALHCGTWQFMHCEKSRLVFNVRTRYSLVIYDQLHPNTRIITRKTHVTLHEDTVAYRKVS